MVGPGNATAVTERRFYVAQSDVGSSELTLQGDEARHARRALRLREGDPVTCFDGAGHGWKGHIDRYVGDTAIVAIDSALESDRPARPRLVLAQGLVKGDRMDVIVQKATELGVEAVRPIAADRSDVRLEPARAAKRVERWLRIAIEAAKQSERMTVPTIEQPTTLDLAVAAAEGPIVALVERSSLHIREALDALDDPGTVTLVVGPEGGWSEEERTRLEGSGAACVSLGRGILRAETAAIAGLAIVRYALRSHEP